MKKHIILLVLTMSLNIGATVVVPKNKTINLTEATELGIDIKFEESSFPCGGMTGVIVNTPLKFKNQKLVTASISHRKDEILPQFINRTDEGNALTFCIYKNNRITLMLELGYLENQLITTQMDIKLYEN